MYFFSLNDYEESYSIELDYVGKGPKPTDIEFQKEMVLFIKNLYETKTPSKDWVYGTVFDQEDSIEEHLGSFCRMNAYEIIRELYTSDNWRPTSKDLESCFSMDCTYSCRDIVEKFKEVEVDLPEYIRRN